MSVRPLRQFLHLLQFSCPDPVLIHLRQDRFDLREHAGTVQDPGQQRNPRSLTGCNQAKKQYLSGLGKHLAARNARLFKNTVGKPGKAQNVNVPDPAALAHVHKRLLRLKGILLRNEHNESFFRMCLRFLKDA